MTGSSVPGPPGQDPDTSGQDAENVRAAARLRDQRDGWVVVWAPPLRCFSASPPFRAPRGTHLRAATIDELAALMDKVEQAAAPRPAGYLSGGRSQSAPAHARSADGYGAPASRPARSAALGARRPAGTSPGPGRGQADSPRQQLPPQEPGQPEGASAAMTQISAGQATGTFAGGQFRIASANPGHAGVSSDGDQARWQAGMTALRARDPDIVLAREMAAPAGIIAGPSARPWRKSAP